MDMVGLLLNLPAVCIHTICVRKCKKTDTTQFFHGYLNGSSLHGHNSVCEAPDWPDGGALVTAAK